MPKLEDQSVLTKEEIGSQNCSVCGEHLEFVKNNSDLYEVKCCDKIYVLNAVKFQATVRKNPYVKVPKPDDSLQNHKPNHPVREIKSRRYV
jgi:hypothetical protein